MVRFIEYLQRNDVDFALRLNSDVMEPYIPQNALLFVKKNSNYNEWRFDSL